MGNFHTIVTIIGTLIIAVSFSTAFLIQKNKGIPEYLNYFYLYPLFALLISLFTLLIIIAGVYKITFAATIEKIIVVVDFSFWGFFFINLFKNNNSKSARRIITFAFLSTLVLVVLSNLATKNAYDGLGYANLAKSLFCIIYFHSLFKSLPHLSLRHEPAFWIVTGLLFYSTISTPIYLSINLFYSNHSINLINILFPLTNIAIIVMHLLFIKGYLCKIQQPKTS